MKENIRKVWILYDGECPVCNNYVHKVRIEKTIGKLILVNARDESQLLDEVKKQNLNVDEGMVLKFNDVLYYGSDAINMIALLGTRIGFFNKINYYIFGNKILAKILYPICKIFRNILLFILRVPKINDKQSK